jgi:hypothetical protein
MRDADLDRATRFEVFGIILCKHKLADPLQRYQR